ncbi:TlpA family protein disulfide reductase [Marisediminicola senii]|uniref:TlpA family protein disulfide reductase n=1 Tax=Marisediminicola senii TaxID=2711233 RepID=UPI0013EABB9B|nr:TlpA disulfide reductase family protein [Marisediminicola senii]
MSRVGGAVPLRAAAASIAIVAVALVSGCSSDPLAEDYLDGGNTNYISGDGIVEVPEAERGDPIDFAGTTDTGETVSRADFDGEVVVVNFWYAACAPCRAEAPDLEAVAQQYDGNGAAFIGVNVYDSAENSLAFARRYDVSYPSLLDASDGSVRLAFAGDIAPNAVPTTFVLDAEGRIAARILGQIAERSILDTLVGDVVAETR